MSDKVRSTNRLAADPNSNEWLSAFIAAAESYTAETTRSKKAAVKALKKNGLLTKAGRLSKRSSSGR